MALLTDRNGVDRFGRVTGAGNRVNRAGNLEISDSVFRWTMEGKIFEAGFGAGDSAIALDATYADITPLFSLQAPASSSVLVIPIITKLAIVDDGNSITIYSLTFTKPAGLCNTALVLSGGTALTSKHDMYRTDPEQTAQQATAFSNLTATALIASDYIAYHYGAAIDAVLTTGLVGLGDGPSNVHTWNFFDEDFVEGFPHILTSGAAQLIYGQNSTVDATALCYFQWAEVTEDDLF